VSSFSWSTFDDPSPGTLLAIINAVWYSALLLSVVSILSASQLSIALSRIATYRTDLIYTRRMLAKEQPHSMTTSGLQLSRSKLFLWQIPVMLLNGSIYLYVIGLTILVYLLACDFLAAQNNTQGTLVYCPPNRLNTYPVELTQQDCCNFHYSVALGFDQLLDIVSWIVSLGRTGLQSALIATASYHDVFYRYVVLYDT
jgi:hypothetical protein